MAHLPEINRDLSLRQTVIILICNSTVAFTWVYLGVNCMESKTLEDQVAVIISSETMIIIRHWRSWKQKIAGSEPSHAML